MREWVFIFGMVGVAAVVAWGAGAEPAVEVAGGKDAGVEVKTRTFAEKECLDPPAVSLEVRDATLVEVVAGLNDALKSRLVAGDGAKADLTDRARFSFSGKGSFW